jgi:hypothetical protein
VAAVITREELESAHCWEAADEVPGRPRTTAFRRTVRYHQARWRERHGHPIGSQPIAPRPADRRVRPVGSRIPLDYARESGANFLTDGALAAARARTGATEPHQSFDHQRLWADLLSSPALAFNLFGDLAADLALADRAVHTWWPDAPGSVAEVRFAHSPGRLDPGYLNSLRAFDVAFVLDLGTGRRGVVGVDTRYHDWTKPETPKPENRNRYLEVARASGAFAHGVLERLAARSGLAEMWLEHLLVLSMLQHRSGAWQWGRFVVVHPAGNPDYVDGCARYAELLRDRSTYASASVEDLLAAGALPGGTADRLRERYLPSDGDAVSRA